jgi:hypothetical protein
VRPDPLDQLLGRGRLSRRAKEDILEDALRDAGVIPPRWYKRKAFLWGSPAFACAAAFALVLGLRAPTDSMRAKGQGRRTVISVECGGVDPARCTRTDKILFRVEGVPATAYLVAYGQLDGTGERVWFFPMADGTEPIVAAGDEPQVLREGVNAGSLPAGRYEIHALLAPRPLSRNEIVSASDKDVIARRSTRLEVTP